MQYRCPNCDHVYDEATGDPHEGFPAGTPWSQVPHDWACPGCAVRDKVDFEPVTQGNSTAPMRAAIVPDRPST